MWITFLAQKRAPSSGGLTTPLDRGRKRFAFWKGASHRQYVPHRRWLKSHFRTTPEGAEKEDTGKGGLGRVGLKTQSDARGCPRIQNQTPPLPTGAGTANSLWVLLCLLLYLLLYPDLAQAFSRVTSIPPECLPSCLGSKLKTPKKTKI